MKGTLGRGEGRLSCCISLAIYKRAKRPTAAHSNRVSALKRPPPFPSSAPRPAPNVQSIPRRYNYPPLIHRLGPFQLISPRCATGRRWPSMSQINMQCRAVLIAAPSDQRRSGEGHPYVDRLQLTVSFLLRPNDHTRSWAAFAPLSLLLIPTMPPRIPSKTWPHRLSLCMSLHVVAAK